jgi:hypothetical protein
MSHPATLLPPRRPELVIGPLGERGETVVKDPRGGGYFHLGAAEAFLLSRLDGRQTADETRAAYRERFGEALSDEELAEYLEAAQGLGGGAYFADGAVVCLDFFTSITGNKASTSYDDVFGYYTTC